MENKRFGRLLVVKLTKSDRRGKQWECLCDCGNTKLVYSSDLNGGKVSSCGCLVKENSRKQGKRNKTHGLSKTLLYKTHQSMLQRCYKDYNENYPNYGGRGIEVCEEWHEFEEFKKWSVDNGYEEGLSIERIDVDGNYEPSNCKWISVKEQQRNKRNNRLITFNGETKTLVEWSEITGIKRSTISARLDRYGMTPEEALTIKGGYGKTRTTYEVTNVLTNETVKIHSKKELDKFVNKPSSSITLAVRQGKEIGGYLIKRV